MDRIAESIEIFAEEFRPQPAVRPLTANETAGLHPAMAQMLQQFGVCARDDGFMWLVDPTEYDEHMKAFGLDLKVVARDSVATLYLSNEQGHLYSFLPFVPEAYLMSEDLPSSLTTVGDRDLTDDEEMLEVHRTQVAAGMLTDHRTCYCFDPPVPDDDADEAPRIYVGDVHEWLRTQAELTAHDSE